MQDVTVLVQMAQVMAELEEQKEDEHENGDKGNDNQDEIGEEEEEDITAFRPGGTAKLLDPSPTWPPNM